MTHTFARNLNILFVYMICAPLIGAYAVQFIQGEFPCPLCLLQRLAMIGIACGALANIRYGIRPRHYGMCIVSAMFGAAVSIRQITLHIVPAPGNEGYGTPILGIHLYTWALLIFGATILILGMLFLFNSKQFYTKDNPKNLTPLSVSRPGVIAFWLVFGITAANACTTFLECGFSQCPCNPARYIMLQ